MKKSSKRITNQAHLLEGSYVIASIAAHEHMAVLVIILDRADDVGLALGRHAGKHLEGVCKSNETKIRLNKYLRLILLRAATEAEAEFITLTLRCYFDSFSETKKMLIPA